jgi:hypothetical protein
MPWGWGVGRGGGAESDFVINLTCREEIKSSDFRGWSLKGLDSSMRIQFVCPILSLERYRRNNTIYQYTVIATLLCNNISTSHFLCSNRWNIWKPVFSHGKILILPYSCLRYLLTISVWTYSMHIFKMMYYVTGMRRLDIIETREYWTIYSGPGCLAVVWFGSFPTPFPSLSSLLDDRRQQKY